MLLVGYWVPVFQVVVNILMLKVLTKIGEGGIRTHGSLHFIWFQIRRNRPTLPPLLKRRIIKTTLNVKYTTTFLRENVQKTISGKKGFEPLTPWFVAMCSSPLSYKLFLYSIKCIFYYNIIFIFLQFMCR